MIGFFIRFWVLLAMLLCGAAHASDDWTQIKETETHYPIVGDWFALPGDLRAIVASSKENRIFAVGERGTIVRSRDSARTWEARPSGTDKALWDLALLDDE